MKLTVALLLASLPLLAAGGESLYYALTNRQQTIVPCNALAGQPPRATWVKLTGCELDYVGAGYRQTDGRITELFFPVRPAGQDRSTPAPLVAATRNPEVLAIAQGTIGDARQPDQEAFLVMMLKIVTTLQAAREVDGYVRRGVVQALPTRRTLATLEGPLAPDAAVLDIHERPDLVIPALLTGAGVLALVAAAATSARSRRTRIAVAPDDDESAVTGHTAPAATLIQPAPAIDRPSPQVAPLPSLMLLNLPPAAPRAEIERAPALGSRAEVQRTIASALPDVAFHDGGRGSLFRADVSVSFDLGPGEPIWAVVVRADGPGAASTLQSLLSATGWRAYAPKRGDFVDFTDAR